MDVLNAKLEFNTCVLFVNSKDNQRKLPKNIKQAYTNTQIRILDPLVKLRNNLKDRRAFDVLQYAMDPVITMRIADKQVVADCALTGRSSIPCVTLEFNDGALPSKTVATGTSIEFVLRIYLHAHFTERMMIPADIDELYEEFMKSEQFIYSLNKYLL